MAGVGRVALVTGGGRGIGRAIAVELGGAGLAVIVGARTRTQIDETVALVRGAGGTAVAVELDVTDAVSVGRAVGRAVAEAGAVDVLVNNAGIAGTRGVTPDGFDLTYATNHIGPFLLTTLLLPRIREAPQGRIVNVSSMAHLGVKQIDWSVLERRTEPKRSGFSDYAVTKLMNVLHAKELARRLGDSRVTTYALHPGAVASNIWRRIPQPIQWFIKLFMLSNEAGAQTPLYCATAPELATVTGRYYDKSREAAPSPLAEDPALARELWERTEAAIGAAS
jgi:retinol dehydrogenase 12